LRGHVGAHPHVRQHVDALAVARRRPLWG
jgi:hypothetical protein